MGEGNRHVGIPVERRIVIYDTPLIENTAVSMIGEFIQTQIGHHDEIFTEGILQILDRNIQDAIGFTGRRATGIANFRNPKDHHTAKAQQVSLPRCVNERCSGVLNNTGQR
jgi:hypothetical protein